LRFPREPKDNSTNSTNPSLGVFPDFSYERIGKLGDPRQIGERLQGPLGEFWRYRVGDYRIICSLEHDRLVVLVLRIGHRREIYK